MPQIVLRHYGTSPFAELVRVALGVNVHQLAPMLWQRKIAEEGLLV